MVEIVTCENAHLHGDLLNDMFRLRHEVLVGELGWEDQERPDGKDIDQFDTDQTTYVIGINDHRKVLASCRLLPTTGPHLMSDIFSHLCRGGKVPQGDNIYELSRAVTPPKHRYGAEARPAFGQVFVGAIEHALAVGVNQFTMVTDMRQFSSLLENGWRLKMLGLPTRDKDGTTIVAGIGEFDEEALRIMRERHNVSDSTLNYQGMTDPRNKRYSSHRHRQSNTG